jgi:hypothetical protein
VQSSVVAHVTLETTLPDGVGTDVGVDHLSPPSADSARYARSEVETEFGGWFVYAARHVDDPKQLIPSSTMPGGFATIHVAPPSEVRRNVGTPASTDEYRKRHVPPWPHVTFTDGPKGVPADPSPPPLPGTGVLNHVAPSCVENRERTPELDSMSATEHCAADEHEAAWGTLFAPATVDELQLTPPLAVVRSTTDDAA